MSDKLRLLDTFCGVGGCTKGYQRAGFYVVGIDIKPQPHYCGDEFYQADALEYIAKHGHELDVIHASPPCQGYSEATPMQYRGNHPALIAPVRELLEKIGRPYVIENVEGARAELRNPVMLCGTMFELPIWRHRYFETWPLWLMSPATCKHQRHPITVHSGSHTRHTWEPVLCTGGSDGQKANRKTHRPRESVDVVRWAMQIEWMVQDELTEAIPPAYTEWIGQQLIAHLAGNGVTGGG
jgi:DNA (cytosine-5)-methyltransferase 1